MKNNIILAAATAKSLQSCPTLCDPIDGSPPGSVVPGVLQARILEWVAISFSSPVATAEFSKFAGILSAALSQHHLLGFEIAQLLR